MTDTKRLRRIGHAVGLECGHNAGKMIEEAADTIDAQAGDIERLRDVLRQITRTPTTPFPDPHAHSVRVFSDAVWIAWSQIQRIARAALSQGEQG